MPFYKNLKIEILTPKSAYSLGYLTLEEYKISQTWINDKISERINNRIVYVSGVYMCTAKATTPLYEIVEKLHL